MHTHTLLYINGTDQFIINILEWAQKFLTRAYIHLILLVRHWLHLLLKNDIRSKCNIWYFKTFIQEVLLLKQVLLVLFYNKCTPKTHKTCHYLMMKMVFYIYIYICYCIFYLDQMIKFVSQMDIIMGIIPRM